MRKLTRSTVLQFVLIVSLVLLAGVGRTHAQPLPPGITNPPPCLNSWSFDDTNAWASDFGYVPVSFTNLSASDLGEFWAMVVDSTNAAWVQYNVLEADGTTNLTVDQGSVLFWFAPNWSGTNEGGTGPGGWGRLLEVGAYTPDASYGWWSVYVDPDGVNLYFSAQTNGTPATTYLSAPIDWTTNRWHLIAITYSSTNSSLYLDGALVVTNGPGVTVWPGPDVLANGFCIGSDSNGLTQAHGMFDQLTTYNYPVGSNTVNRALSRDYADYYLNPMNFANLSQAPFIPQITPTFNAVTGPGVLTPVSTNTLSCITSAGVWITNVLATMATNGTMAVTFTISGGSNAVAYDVFANSILDFSSNTNLAWAWLGQGYQCVTYTLTNLPNTACFLILGTPIDSDQDGLTDAYERLVSKTDPHKADSSGDGILDGWKLVWGLNLFANNPAQTGKRSNFTYYPEGWLWTISGVKGETVETDFEGNVTGN
jgi:hypothetical protein